MIEINTRECKVLETSIEQSKKECFDSLQSFARSIHQTASFEKFKNNLIIDFETEMPGIKVVETLELCKGVLDLEAVVYLRRSKIRPISDNFYDIKRISNFVIDSGYQRGRINLESVEKELDSYCFDLPLQTNQKIQDCSFIIHLQAQNKLIAEGIALQISILRKEKSIQAGIARYYLLEEQRQLINTSSRYRELFPQKELLCPNCISRPTPAFSFQFCKFELESSDAMKEKIDFPCQKFFVEDNTITNRDFIRIKVDVLDPFLISRFSLQEVEADLKVKKKSHRNKEEKTESTEEEIESFEEEIKDSLETVWTIKKIDDFASLTFIARVSNLEAYQLETPLDLELEIEFKAKNEIVFPEELELEVPIHLIYKTSPEAVNQNLVKKTVSGSQSIWFYSALALLVIVFILALYIILRKPNNSSSFEDFLSPNEKKRIIGRELRELGLKDISELGEKFLDDEDFEDYKRDPKKGKRNNLVDNSVEYQVSESEDDDNLRGLRSKQKLVTIKEKKIEESPYEAEKQYPSRASSRMRASGSKATDWDTEDDMTEHSFKVLKESTFSSDISQTTGRGSAFSKKKDNIGRASPNDFNNANYGKKRSTRSTGSGNRRSARNPTTGDKDPFEMMNEIEGFENRASHKKVLKPPKPSPIKKSGTDPVAIRSDIKDNSSEEEVFMMKTSKVKEPKETILKEELSQVKEESKEDNLSKRKTEYDQFESDEENELPEASMRKHLDQDGAETPFSDNSSLNNFGTPEGEPKIKVTRKEKRKGSGFY